LVWSKYPTYNWKQVKGLILNGTEDGLHRAFYWGYNLTQGRLNLNTSLSAATINTPAVFAVNPEITQVGQPITLTGINFGSTRGALLQDDDCIYNYPAGSIISWNNERIVVRVSGNCRYGEGLLKAKVGAKLSRGAFFRTNLNEYNYTHWLYPTYQGETLLQHQEAASAQVGNDVWIFGGRDTYNDSSNRVERFSLLTLRGEVQPDWEMPKGIRNASAAAIGTKIYVVGGYDDATKKLQSQLQIFDTVTRMWTRGRNLPQPLSDASVIAVSNQIWVMGGSGVNNTGLKTTYLYDPVTNRWLTDKASLPLKRANAGVATPRAGKIWLVSGYTESGGSWYRTKDVLEYDIATNTWDIRDDIPLNGEHAGAAVTSMNGKTFAIYGDGDGGAGEWLPAPGPSEGLKWSRNIAHFEYQPTYTPMIGTNLNTRTIYIISGSRGRSVFKFEIP
jgi:N-acetylneuraminic acid mutarotase